MNDNGFMTAAEMKEKLGLKSQKRDYRTLNRYVIEGKLEIKILSRKIKLYRFPAESASNDNHETVDLDFCL